MLTRSIHTNPPSRTSHVFTLVGFALAIHTDISVVASHATTGVIFTFVIDTTLAFWTACLTYVDTIAITTILVRSTARAYTGVDFTLTRDTTLTRWTAIGVAIFLVTCAFDTDLIVRTLKRLTLVHTLIVFTEVSIDTLHALTGVVGET